MKRSKTWFASILIALALLLSSGKNLSAQSLRPRQSPPQQRNETLQHPQTNAEQGPSSGRIEQTPTAINSPSREGHPKERGREGDQNSRPLRKIREWIANISSQAFFNFITAAATAILAVFTGQLVCVTRDLHKATEAALHVNRPFLLVVEVRCDETKFANGVLTHRFAVVMRNFGVGPADVLQRDVWTAVHDFPTTSDSEPQLTYRPYSVNNRFRESLVVAPGETTDRITCRSDLTHQMYVAVQDRTKALAVDGIVHYRGASPKVYDTNFFWWCFIDDQGRPTGIVRALRPDLNEHT